MSTWNMSREELISSLNTAIHELREATEELAPLRALVDELAEKYPGESPSDDQLRDWISGLIEKAWQYDELCR